MRKATLLEVANWHLSKAKEYHVLAKHQASRMGDNTRVADAKAHAMVHEQSARYVSRLISPESREATSTLCHASSIPQNNPLTLPQIAHIAGVSSDSQRDMEVYLRTGVSVTIFRQDDCGRGAMPYCISVDNDPAFWIDCKETAEIARDYAILLGLRVTRVQL